MATDAAVPAPTAGKCWIDFGGPSSDLLDALKGGRLAGARAQGPAPLSALLASLRRDEVARPVIFVGAGTCGLGAGAGKTLAAVKNFLETDGRDADVVEVGCIGLCSEEPIVDVQLPGRARLSFGSVTADKVPGLLHAVFEGGPLPADMAPRPVPPELGAELGRRSRSWTSTRSSPASAGSCSPPAASSTRAASTSTSPGAATRPLAKALRTHDARRRSATWSKRAGCAGAAAAASPPGKKWKFARAAPADQKYLICNADEGDPGAFMDRAVGESDPHRLLEGMLIAAYAIGATKAYIYIRAEYPLAVRRLTAGDRAGHGVRPARRRTSSTAASTSRSSSRWAPARSSAARRPP